MCGIYGWQWKPNAMPSFEKRYLIATLLGAYNDSRGGDSFGWYAPESGQLYHDLGLAGKAARLASAHPTLIGHTRKATVGAATIENAHPFVMGHIIGAHNGGVSNHGSLPKKFEVDSMHIFDRLNEGKDLSELYGYGAIEWVDTTRAKGEVLLCRISGHGDLGVCITDHGIVWSSRKDDLERTLWLAGVDGKVFELKHEVIHIAKRGRLFESDSKLFFGEWKSYNYQGNQTSGTGGKAYGSSQVKSDGDKYRENWQKTFEHDDPSELDIVDAAAESVKKTMGKRAKRRRNKNPNNSCEECGWIHGHYSGCVNYQKPPRPTAPAVESTSIVKKSDFLQGSTIICVSCYNDIDHHATGCVIGGYRNVGGGVGGSNNEV